MEHQDNIFEKFKKAAENSESNDFPGLEKVWSRVDAKLNTQAYQTQKKANSSWKKFAVAASVVVGTAFAYQFFGYRLFKEAKIKPTVESTVKAVDRVNKQSIDTTVASNDTIETTKAVTIVTSKEAKRILETHVNSLNQVAVKEPSGSTIKHDTITLLKQAAISKTTIETEKRNTGRMLREKAFQSTGVKRYKIEDDNEEEYPIKQETTESKKVTLKKAPPLIVVDGKVAKTLKDAEEGETIMELEEPLYIVNGVEYSEKEMFGPNPTSPYYPLNKQDIESVVIYEGKEAIERFGQKGAKGVVIVRTKDGKPAVLKK
ncbi:hypothetical protein NAT51_05630 [Flavobacterium amniphilum]|uniref:hypothetical protein n=1 Tax=Flavobacterium amniphilum TaxID=1834035 RepID=UPI002029D6DF|nr:hypothetical protein [Flavobacterium amniphilum]MCL9804988.1 hypothetical protein [Flavobacterium amniphilum]